MPMQMRGTGVKMGTMTIMVYLGWTRLGSRSQNGSQSQNQSRSQNQSQNESQNESQSRSWNNSNKRNRAQTGRGVTMLDARSKHIPPRHLGCDIPVMLVPRGRTGPKRGETRGGIFLRFPVTQSLTTHLHMSVFQILQQSIAMPLPPRGTTGATTEKTKRGILLRLREETRRQIIPQFPVGGATCRQTTRGMFNLNLNIDCCTCRTFPRLSKAPEQRGKATFLSLDFSAPPQSAPHQTYTKRPSVSISNPHPRHHRPITTLNPSLYPQAHAKP